MTDRGRFITFEGGEGAGKSTQARLLAQALAARGIDAVVTREPGGTAGAEAIRSLLLSTEGDGWLPRAEALLFAAARSDHVARLIVPALSAGRWVVCDRFLDSSRAYQGARAAGPGGRGEPGLDDADILALHRIGSHGLLPDVSLLIEVSSDVAATRLAARDADGADRIGGRPADYHARVAAGFAAMAHDEPDRWVRIDGNGTAEDTHAAVLAALGLAA